MTDGIGDVQLAGMFQLPPKPKPAPAAEPGGATEATAQPGTDTEAGSDTGLIRTPTWQLPTTLTWQWGYGSESDVEYRRNPDLNNHIQDNFLIIVPEINAHVIYRPTDWVETTLELILQYEYAAQEQDILMLPDGEVQYAEERGASLLVDQAFITLGKISDPFQFSLGRRNYEDNRHWLYDASMDILMLQHKTKKFKTQLTFGREIFLNLDPLKRQIKDRINTLMLYAEYRGIEDMQLGAYAIYRNDLDTNERPLLFGLRSLAFPSKNLNYWTELAYLDGHDELSRNFSAYAFDVGGTYRFLESRRQPNITLGYAFATGDDPNSSSNNEFRQSGLQSNEARFAGVSEFRYYGEGLSPELSNLNILTVGVGFHPAYNMTLDLVYHKYRLDEIAEELRNSDITALMNQDDTRLSKDVGSGVDIVLGIRRVFGIKRLGLDIRAGWFFPGAAFRIEQEDGSFRDADGGSAIYVKVWY
jgi:alginate production protein